MRRYAPQSPDETDETRGMPSWRFLLRSYSPQVTQAAKEELRSIVKAWNDAFAFEAFFTELSRRASALDGDERASLEARIQRRER